MKNVQTITFHAETYRENFDAIVTREKDGQKYILAAFLERNEAINYAIKYAKKYLCRETIKVYECCKAISRKVNYDRFREIKY